jgi:metal-responsive CopG/Arc/MetJ family transcriptional regulator
MKVKTSITLSEALLATIELLPEEHRNRSQFFETAAWAYIAHLRRQEQVARDLAIYEQRAEYLNAEVADALAYQTAL